MRRLFPLVLACFALAAPASASASAATPFDGQGMWIHEVPRTERGDVSAIAERAASAGLSYVVVKAAHGTVPWLQFSVALVDALHGAGVRVCAYQRALARRPASEALVLARTVRLGADCLVIDAEIEYQGKYLAARSYMRSLRGAIGPSFPVGLTSFPYVDLHWNFPYSEFLGPGGAQVTLPQMYWRLLGTGVPGVFARTWAANAVYGRPIVPLGQVFGPAVRSEVRRFRSLAAARGAPGVSWWVWQHASVSHWAGLTDLVTAPLQLFAARPAFALLRYGARGDQVRWLQMRLRAVGEDVPVTGRFLGLTAAALGRFRVRSGLPAGGGADDAAWNALLAAAPLDDVLGAVPPVAPAPAP